MSAETACAACGYPTPTAEMRVRPVRREHGHEDALVCRDCRLDIDEADAQAWLGRGMAPAADPFARMGDDDAPAPAAQAALPLPREYVCCVCQRRTPEIHRVPLGPRQARLGGGRAVLGVCATCAELRRCDVCDATCAADELGPFPRAGARACERCRARHCGTCGVELEAADVELGLDVCEACAFSPGCHERAPHRDSERVAAVPGGGR